MKKNLSLIILLIFAVILLSGCQSQQVVAHPILSKIGGDVTGEYRFSPSFSIEDVTKAPLISVKIESTEEMVKNTSTLLGVNSEDMVWQNESSDMITYYVESKDLSIIMNKTNGFWQIIPNDSNLTGPPEVKNLPDEKEAIEIATRYIQENQIYVGELGEGKVTYSYAGSEITGDKRNIAANVYFFPEVDGKQVLGVYKLIVTLGENGTIREVSKQANSFSYEQKVRLKTTEETIDEVMNHPDNIIFTNMDVNNVVITKCELRYYCDGIPVNGHLYLYPVYSLIGYKNEEKATDNMDEHQEVYMILDAVA